MQAIWQLTDAVIIPIITYGAESWDATKKEIEEIQKILNNCLKTIPCLPQGTPTQILLAETGYLPIQYYIYKKRIIQWHRIQKKPETALIKKITQGNNSTWKEKTIKIMNELRFCKKEEETQRHLLQECNKIPWTRIYDINYDNAFSDANLKQTREAAQYTQELCSILEENPPIMKSRGRTKRIGSPR